MSDQVNFIDLSDFVLQKTLISDDGSFSQVFTAVKKQDPTKIYAVKIFRYLLDPSDKKQMIEIKREVNILLAARHPYIVKFIGYSPIDFNFTNHPVIITEFAPKETLNKVIKLEILKKAPNEWTKTKKLINLFGIASIMSYLHKNKIIHRDLKPSNILEDENYYPIIADFGQSKVYHPNNSEISTESEEQIRGTISYIAPEVFDCEYTYAADVYAYAIIAYQLMNIREPYNTNNQNTIMRKVITNERPEFNSRRNVPECYKKLIESCWDQDRLKRPSFDQIVEKLKEESFITNDIDRNEYLNYIQLIESQGQPFDHEKKFHQITPKQENDNNKEADIDKKEDDINNKEVDDDDDDETDVNDENTNEDVKEIIIAKLIIDLEVDQNFVQLSNEMQNLIKQKLTKMESNNEKALTFINEESMDIYTCGTLNSTNFKSVLSCFPNVVFEINSDEKCFNDIFENLCELSKELNMIKTHINTSNPVELTEIIKRRILPISIAINSCITSIEPNTFSECKSLYQITIPESVKSIGFRSFFKCSSLKQIEIPSNVELIEEGAFCQCYDIKKVDFKTNLLKRINKLVFSHCESLKKITLPSSVTIIETSAFESCSSLEEIKYPSTIEKIDCYAFKGCEKLRKFVIPSTFKTIKMGIFYGCSSLTSIKIPSSVEIIESDAFNSCQSLKEIIFEDQSSLKSIRNNAFSVCSSLETINIPESVKIIGPFCFFGCIKLNEITLPAIDKIDDNVFDGCISLNRYSIPQSVKSIKSFAFNKCFYLTEIIIPPSVTSIKKYAFYCCSSLTKLIIPSSVEDIDIFAFAKCASLTEIIFENGSKLASIEKGSFKECCSLQSLSLPKSVKKIKDEAFYKCYELKEITLPPKLNKIGMHAFCECSKLESIDIPRCIKKIGMNAFENCNSLKKIRLPRSIKNDKDIGLNPETKIEKYL